MKSCIEKSFVLPVLVAVVAVLAACPSQAQFTYTVTNGTVTIIGYNSTNGVVSIPDTIASLPVTAIGDNAFDGNYILTTVTIPDSVTSIGVFAFYQCTGLTSITIPNGVTSIGDAAFQFSGLTHVIVGNGTTNIGTAKIAYRDDIVGTAFFGCNGLTAISVEKNNPTYSSVDGVLFDKSQTTLLQYPAGAETSYAIPNSVTSIGAGAFGETRLTSVTIPGSVTNIGPGSFFDCAHLTGAYFQGDAPSGDSSVFFPDHATAYYLPGTIGWGSTFGGIPTALWSLPYPLILNSSLGVRSHQFGFTVSWPTNLSVVVEATPDLRNPNWSPLITNALNNGVVNFTDPQCTNYPSRFYRVRSQ